MLPQNELEFLGRQLKKLKCKTLDDYYASEQWKLTKRLLRNHKGAMFCSVCGCTEELLHLHHRTYEHLGEEFQHEVTWLCNDCHIGIHADIDYILSGASLLEYVEQKRRSDVEGVIMATNMAMMNKVMNNNCNVHHLL